MDKKEGVAILVIVFFYHFNLNLTLNGVEISDYLYCIEILSL